MNVIIYSDDSYFKHGMSHVLSDIYHENITVLYNLTSDNIEKADLIILTTLGDKGVFCESDLNLYNDGFIIAVHDEKYTPIRLPSRKCIDFIKFAKKNSPVEYFYKLIGSLKTREMINSLSSLTIPCVNCKRASLSKKQKEFVILFSNGYSLQEISIVMASTYKTTANQYGNIKRKFELKSKHHFVVFFRLYFFNDYKYAQKGNLLRCIELSCL